MDKGTMLGVPFYRFYYPPEKRDKVREDIYHLNWKRNPQNWMWDGADDERLQDLPQFTDLFEWFHECLNEVKTDLKLTCDSLKIVSSWANLNQKGQSFHDHVHPNSFMSSNYYVCGGEGTHTVWHTKNPYFENNILPIGYESEVEIKHYEPTEPGKFIVFPPHIYHYSTDNMNDADRITIAANIFPNGSINYGSVSRFNISV